MNFTHIKLTRWVVSSLMAVSLFSVSVIGMSSDAHALVTPFAEPYLGWSALGQMNVNNTPTGDVKLGSFSGAAIGARFGVTGLLGMIFAGFDVSHLPSVNFNPTALGMFDSGNMTRVGVVGGVTLPIPLFPVRAWVGYNFIDKLSSSSHTLRASIPAGTDLSLSGHAFKVGAGYLLLSLISINAEYIAEVGNSYEVASGSAAIPYSGNQVTSHSLLLSVGLPVTLGI